MSIYRFLKSFAGNLGVGVQDMGYIRSSSEPLTPLNGSGTFVRRSLGPTAPGYAKTGQQIVPVSWLGNGNTGYAPAKLTRLAEKG